MNEITFHGNVVSKPEVRSTRDGRTIITFRLAVNRRRFDNEKRGYVNMPAVFHQVVTFGPLADNAAATLDKGMTVTVTGQLVDDSFTTPSGHHQQRTAFHAVDIAVSLRWATAQVTKTTTAPARAAEQPDEDTQPPADEQVA